MEINEVLNEDNQVSLDKIASNLAYQPIQDQREFLQVYFICLKEQTYSKKHFEAMFASILSENTNIDPIVAIRILKNAGVDLKSLHKELGKWFAND